MQVMPMTDTTVADLPDDVLIYTTPNAPGGSTHCVHTDADCHYLHKGESSILKKRPSMYADDMPICSRCAGEGPNTDTSRKYYNQALAAGKNDE